MREWKSVAFAYDVRQDRVLAAVNAGKPDSWSGWMIRRLAMALLERTEKLLADTLALAQQAPAEIRDDLVAFERDAALAQTEQGLHQTSTDIVNASKTTAELVEQAIVSKRGRNFRFELKGESGDGAGAVMSRADIRRVMQMLHAQILKSDWLQMPAKAVEARAAPQAAPKPARH